MKKLNRLLVVILFWTFWEMVLSPSQAFASGPGEGGRRVRLDDEAAGPYLVRVVTSPTPPRVENLYVEVRVLESNSSQVIVDAQVTILAAPEGEPTPTLREVATHDIAPIPTEYAAHLVIPEAGLWRITIQVESDMGMAEVEFLARVSKPSSIGVIFAVGAPVVGIAILALIFLRLQRATQEAQKDSNTPQGPSR
jgi:hypothetical protein